MALSEKEKQNALNEVRILASINNPYIIGYKEAFFEDNTSLLCIVMEHAAGGDIYNKITQHQRSRTFFKEEEIWTSAIQMIIGLKTLHDMKILHRDLKSANIFLSKDAKTVKLGDLNVSKVAKANLVYTQTGTPYYASPEVWRDQPYDLKSDIWSLGCVIYEMAALKPPFRANDMQGLNRKIQKGVFDRIPSQYSSDLTSLISMCLQVSPSMRPNCDKLLSHPLILKYGKEVIQNMETEDSNELLGTIVLPRNIKALAGKLPKPNYHPGVRSEEFEKGSLNNLDDKERDIQSRRGQRALSQQGPKIENKILDKNRAQSGHRPLVDSESEKNLMRKAEQEAAEKLRQINERPRPVDMVRRVPEPSEAYVPRKRSINQNKENVPENVPRVSKGYSEQDYLINRYMNVDASQMGNKYGNRKAVERPYMDRDDQISKRAENIVRKYYNDAALAERREPLAEIKPVNVTPQNAPVKDAIDILERYNNAHNARRDLYQKPEYIHVNQNVNENRRYLGRENNIHQANPSMRQDQQLRGIVRPSWWG